MDEILPCPCCGGESEFKRDHAIYAIGCDGYVIIGNVICTKCGLGQTFEKEESEAIKDWNTRKGGGALRKATPEKLMFRKGKEVCPVCGMPLDRLYSGMDICYCKHCGQKIERRWSHE